MKNIEIGEIVDHIPKIIGETGQEVLREPVIQPLEESDKIVLARSIGIIGEDIFEGTQKKEVGKPKFETEGKDEERVGMEISKEGLEAIDTTVEGGESEKVLAMGIGVSGEDRVEGTKQREIEVPKFETEDRDKGRVEDIFETTQKKEIGQPEFETEGKDEERVGMEISKEGLEAIESTVEGGESEKVLAMGIGVRGEDIVEGTKPREIEEPKSETEDRVKKRGEEEIRKEGFEAMETIKKEFPKQAPKLPLQLEESESTVERMEGGEDRIGGAKLKEIEEPMFQSVKEETSKVPKMTDSKVARMGGIEEAKEAMAKRGSQEAEGFVEKVEGEEPKKIKEEASKVIEKDYTREAEKKGNEESSIRPSRDEQNVQENIVRQVSEVSATALVEFPKQMLETKAKVVFPKQMVESKAKEERAVKVKAEVAINIYGEAKEGFEKATIESRIQLETGQPTIGFKDSGEEGFDEKETSEVAKREKIKALKEGPVETEPSVEKVKGEDKMERTLKETEGPEVGTKHKDQPCLQELPMQIAESLANKRKGPKETKIEEMKEAKRKGEETEVVADDESTMKEKIQETEIERMCKTKQFKKALQVVPEAKDTKALGKGTHERESTLSIQQLEDKEKGKICEHCRRLEANLEKEKCRTTQNIKEEENRRKSEVQQVAESMARTAEKEHPRKSEKAEKEVKPLEAKVAYPEVRKEVEPKNEVEEPRPKELPPPKLEMQCLEPLESEKKSMKSKFPETKKHVPEAREEKEEYEAAKPPEVECSSSTQRSMAEEKGKLDRDIDKQKYKTDFPESSMSKKPSEDKEMEALPTNILADQNLEEKEYFKTPTEDRGQQYMPENFDEERSETEKVAEEKLNQKDGEERLPCKSKRTEIAKSEEDKRPKIKEMSQESEHGGEKINQIKQVAEEFKEAVTDNETEKSQKEILSPQTTEIQSKEEIPKITAVQQGKGRKIPSHGSEVVEAVTPLGEVEPSNFTATHSKATSIEFRKDEPKHEFDELQRKELLSPSTEKLSKEPHEIAMPGVKQDAPEVEIFPQFQEDKESIHPLEGTKASEATANEVDKPSTQKLDVEEKGKTDEGLEIEEEEEEASEKEVEKTKFSREESHEGHEIEEKEEEASEQEDEILVEISQESEVLEDIEVEASEKERELCTPMVIAGSAFLASLIIFFIRHRRDGKR